MRKIAFTFTALLIGLYAPIVSSQIVSPEAIASRQAAAQAFLAEQGPHWAVRLSDETGHSSYDCAFVALAMVQGVKLVTGDAKGARLFPDVAVHLEAFAG